MKLKKYSVVARYKDGSTLKGKTNDFTPFKTFFHLDSDRESNAMVDVEDLKAIFFVKEDDEKNTDYRNIKELGGKKIKVHFKDGEEIVGYALEYSSAYHGFFVTPVEPAGNNKRIFVITSATEKLTFL